MPGFVGVAGYDSKVSISENNDRAVGINPAFDTVPTWLAGNNAIRANIGPR